MYKRQTYSFDSGMRKGINYFNQGLYYEARDEFQWFADYNWGSLNSSQQKYLLDYLDGAKAKIKEVEYDNNHLTQEQFDEGMRAGINYFNKGMFYEACDEFQWFCDYNWGKMNAGQRQDVYKRQCIYLAVKYSARPYNPRKYVLFKAYPRRCAKP